MGLATVVALAIATGLRRGELLGLQWPDVMTNGEPNGYLRVRQTLVTVSGHAQFSEPKTRKSRRQFKLGTEALRILRQHRRLQARGDCLGRPVGQRARPGLHA